MHLSAAPMLKVFERHSMIPSLASFGIIPGLAVEQYPAPALEYCPGPSQARQPSKFDAPVSVYFPLGHRRHLFVTAS